MKRIRYFIFAAVVAVATVLIPRAAGTAGGSPPHEAVTLLAARAISNVPGKRLVSILVDYPPGASSGAHRHAASAYIYAYVLAGEIRSQVDGEPMRIYRKGEWWIERPGAQHVVSANASARLPARLLAVFIVDATETELTTPDPQ